MATYLLLRDNKQSGPYTFDELKAKGLKAYDLVWIEGRSAAWRYPGEVEELKPFSPPVVEQPYDRFFRRPTQENKTVTTTKQNTVSEKEINAPVAQQAVIQTGSRNIYVTLPSSARKADTIKESFIPEEPVKREYVAKEPAKQDFVRQTTLGVPMATEEEYFEPRPESNKQAYQKNIKPSGNNVPLYGLKKPLLTAATVIILLGAGIAIGLVISKTSSGSSPKNYNTASKEPVPVSQQANDQAASIPVSEKIAGSKAGDITQDNTNNANISPAGQQGDKKIISGTEKKKNNVQKDKPALPLQLSPSTTNPSPDTNAEASLLQVQHREATHRTDPIPDKDAVKNALLNTVSIGANKYNVGTFGGISELQLTVSNHSVHPLDLVVVEVQYIQANKKIFKTENLYFRNINAGSALMQEAPKSPRGVKVQYRITLINSKEQGLSYSGL